MSSPFIPSPFIYGDIPAGGQMAIIQPAIIAPPTSQNQQQVGTFWINTTNGNLYYLAGYASGIPDWVLVVSDQTTGLTVDMTAGAVTVANSFVTASSTIVYSRKTTSGTAGQVSITAQSAGTFTLTSTSGTETSTFNYLIIN